MSKRFDCAPTELGLNWVDPSINIWLLRSQTTFGLQLCALGEISVSSAVYDFSGKNSTAEVAELSQRTQSLNQNHCRRTPAAPRFDSSSSADM